MAISLAVLAYFTLLHKGSEPTPVETVDVVEVTTTPSYKKSESYLGKIISARNTPLSFEIQGRVVKMLVDEGASVVAGEPLALLDKESLLSKRNEVDADVVRREALFELSRMTKERTEAASSLRAVAERDMDQAEYNYLRDKAAVQASLARGEQINVEIDKAVLTSPFSGAIAKRYLDAGSVVLPGTPIFDIVDGKDLEAVVGVANIEELSLEEVDHITTSHGDVAARYKSQLPVRDRATRNIEVIFSLKEPLPYTIPGDAATLVVKREVERKGAWLPATSLTESYRGLMGVLVARPEGGEKSLYRLSLREVEVVEKTGDLVYVDSYLKDGELVVKSGLTRLIPGLLVTVNNE